MPAGGLPASGLPHIRQKLRVGSLGVPQERHTTSPGLTTGSSGGGTYRRRFISPGWTAPGWPSPGCTAPGCIAPGWPYPTGGWPGGWP